MSEKYLYIPDEITKKIKESGFFIYKGLNFIDFIFVIFDHSLKNFFDFSFFAKSGFITLICFILSYFNSIFLFPIYILGLFSFVAIYLFYAFIIELFIMIIYLTKCGEIVFVDGYFFYMGKLYDKVDIKKIPKKIIYDKDIPKMKYYKYIGYASSDNNIFYLDKFGKEKYFNLIEPYLFNKKDYKLKDIFSIFSQKYNNYLPKKSLNQIEKIIHNFWKTGYFILCIPLLIILPFFYIIGNIIFLEKNIILNFSAIYTPFIFGKIYKNIKIIEQESNNFNQNITIYRNLNKNISQINYSIRKIIKLQKKLINISQNNKNIQSLLKTMVLEKLTDIFSKVHNILEQNINNLKQKYTEIKNSKDSNIILLEKRVSITLKNLYYQKNLIEIYQKKISKKK